MTQELGEKTWLETAIEAADTVTFAWLDQARDPQNEFDYNLANHVAMARRPDDGNYTRTSVLQAFIQHRDRMQGYCEAAITGEDPGLITNWLFEEIRTLTGIAGYFNAQIPPKPIITEQSVAESTPTQNTP